MQKYACVHKELKLCVSETETANKLKVRVTKKPKNRPFHQSLIITPGTTLCLCKGKIRKYITVRLFIPRIQYGKLVAGGVILF
jgi:hypothetical protein